MTETQNLEPASEPASEHAEGDVVKVAVMFVGGLEDCKYNMGILEAAGMGCALDVAERMGPQYANRGYYIVTVPAERGDEAREVLERQLHADLHIEEQDEPDDGMERCPACGTPLVAGCAACPDCGLNFE